MPRAEGSETDMLIYWVMIAAVFAFGLLFCRDSRGKAFYCAACGAVLFMIAAVRRSVGYDYNLYANWFDDCFGMSFDDMSVMKQEKGFLLPMRLISGLTFDYQAMFAVTALVITAGVMLYIYKNCEKPYLGVFCFIAYGLFFNSMNFMRQMIAAVIMLYAFRYIKTGQFGRFFVFVLLASCFHVSVLVMIPFYFILRIPMNNITLGIYAAVTAVCYVFSRQIVSFVTGYFYSEYSLETSAELAKGVDPVYSIFFGVTFAAAYLVKKEICEKSEDGNILINCMFFTFFFELMGTHHGVISRLAVLFFIPAVTVLVPEVICILPEKSEHLMKDGRNASATVKIIIASFCLFMYGYMLANNYNGVVPYQTVL